MKIKLLVLFLLLVGNIAFAGVIDKHKSVVARSSIAAGSSAGPLTFIAGVSGGNTNASATSTASSTLNILTDDVIVCYIGWEDAAETSIDITDGGSNDLVMKPTYNDTGTDNYAAFGILTAATANGTATFVADHVPNAVYRGLVCLQFRPTAGDAISQDGTGQTNQGTGTPITSGTISTTGDYGILIAGYKNYSTNNAITNEQIAGSAADGAVDATSDNLSLWYTLLSGTETSVTGTATTDKGSAAYISEIIAIKAE